MTAFRTALLTGATAQVGLHLLPELRKAGFHVIALSRQAPAIATSAATNDIQWFQPEPFRRVLQHRGQKDMAPIQEPEVLVSAGPIALAVEWLEHCTGIKQVIALSTTSIYSKADSENESERQQIAGIIQAEQQLAGLCTTRGIDLMVFRPTLIYGCGLDENISRMAAFIRRFGFLPLASPASGLRQPVHVADLADLIVRACHHAPAGQHTLAVAGGSRLSYRAMAVRVFAALGKPVRLVSLPPSLLSVVLAVASKLALVRGLNPAMIRRQNMDLIFDDSEARRLFGFQPREFAPGLADFSLPENIRDQLPRWLTIA